MKRQSGMIAAGVIATLIAGAMWGQIGTRGYKVIAWNDLGMHCVDGLDYSVFSILPPFNNIHAQVIDSGGRLVRSNSSVRVTYEAVADPDGSINRTSGGKTNFWQYVGKLFGVNLAPDMGLAGNPMPGAANTPQLMKFASSTREFVAEGVPITPYPDGGGAKNYYPMMRISARDTQGRLLGTTTVVLPVSDEMDCKACHLTGSNDAAKPAGGWVTETDPDRNYKKNVLKLHDERRDRASYGAVLTTAGYSAAGLLATAEGGTPVLCAKCHKSNALPGTGIGTIAPLTMAIHKKHAMVLDPANRNLPLDSVDNRSACYRCHPGSETKCLRGAMGNATAPDGTALMQCQSCHGSMSRVGSVREGWLDEPGCESCHTGTATRNSGQIRFTNVFGASGAYRTAADRRFAVQTGKLYRMSAGHGGLQCEGCHGSTHAEYASSHRNDNLGVIALQGHTGTIAECNACHSRTPETTNGGPHGMHPIGQYWVDKHEDAAENRGTGECQACHGVNLRGSVLSAALADRSFSTEWGRRTFAKGRQIGCYDCHNGPRGD